MIVVFFFHFEEPEYCLWECVCVGFKAFGSEHIGVSWASVDVYGHTTVKTPVLVRSPKLSTVGRG